MCCDIPIKIINSTILFWLYFVYSCFNRICVPISWQHLWISKLQIHMNILNIKYSLLFNILSLNSISLKVFFNNDFETDVFNLYKYNLPQKSSFIFLGKVYTDLFHNLSSLNIVKVLSSTIPLREFEYITYMNLINIYLSFFFCNIKVYCYRMWK